MFGTTREFLDYFGLKRLEDLPPLAEIKDGMPELSPQTDLIDSLEAEARMMEIGSDEGSAEAATIAVAEEPAVDEEPRDRESEHGTVIPLRAAANRGDAVE
jgi:segregation and condensation protein B